MLAEVRKLDIESLAELYDQLKDARAELTTIIADAAVRAEDGRKAQTFLRGQIEWHEELTILARQATHAALGEIQRCIWHIEQRDTLIRECKTAIGYLEEELNRRRIEFLKTKLPDVNPFAQTKHEAIVKWQAMPMPPPRESSD